MSIDGTFDVVNRGLRTSLEPLSPEDSQALFEAMFPELRHISGASPREEREIAWRRLRLRLRPQDHGQA